MPDISFLVGQALSGLTTAMFLFLIASGLALIFGVLGVLNFAHGSFYMFGAYLAWQIVHWAGSDGVGFWLAVLGAAITVAILGAVIERLLLRHLYNREQLYQLLFTYAMVLVLGDAMKLVWGTQQLSVSRPAALNGSIQLASITLPHYNLFILVLGPAITFLLWWVMHRTRAGRLVRAAALDREMLGALGINVDLVRTATFAAGSFLAGLGGALVTPVRSIVPGMDVEIVVQLFTVVVIGGLGSLWGTLLGAIIYGQVLAFGILIFPRFSIFAAFALMAVVLVLRPWGLLGRRPTVR